MQITFLPKIHQKYIYMWNNSYRTPTECWQKTSDFPKDALRRPTHRGGAKSKAEPQELCEQRREREISPSTLRSSRLNLHSQRDVPCICEMTTNHPKLRRWTLRARYIIFSPFPLFVSVYVYASV